MQNYKILNINGALLTKKELEIHLEKIAASHNIKNNSNKETYPIPRLIENYKVIREVYNTLNNHIKLGISIHPAGEWILDNFYIIEEAVKSIENDLNIKKYTNFVGIHGGEYDGFARIYVLASEIVSHTDYRIERENLEDYIRSYQTKKTLSMDEIWNVGIFLQIAIIENIRQISERIYISQIEKYKVESIVERLVENKEKQDQKFNNLKENRKINMFKNMKYPFIEYMSYTLKKYGKKTYKYLNVLEDEVEKIGTSVSDVIKKEHFDIALRKVSIGNCITSIKKIQRINFLQIFEKINGVEEILRNDPAHVYDKMDYKTKENYRNIIKQISIKTKISELYIAKKILEYAQNAKEGSKESHVGYYLIGKNINIIYNELGFKKIRIINESKKTKIYILSIFLVTLIISILIAQKYNYKIYNPIVFMFSVSFLFIPISELVIQIIQYILGKFVKPQIIPKIDFYNGIDIENSTMVVIPTIINSKEKVRELIKKLEVYYIANKSKNLYFTLLGDCTQGEREEEKFDKEIEDVAIEEIDKINNKYKIDGFPIFNFIYRKRIWNEKEDCYLGWERKRGLLLEFSEFLLGKNENTFRLNTLIRKEKLPKIKYIITLDSDTDLILDSAFELVGAMAHILNKPVIDEEKNIVIEGHALIQPRVGVNIDISYKNLFTKIFAGSGGIDSYTNAISDIYQDNFGEGIFTGKGIFDLEVYSKVLKNTIPENQVLSHDLLEGCYLRCGLASDILIMDGYPTKYTSFMTRLARWIRGDWQIICWIKEKKLNVLSRYKIFDNLRRSIFEITTLLSAIYFIIINRIYNVDVRAILFGIILIPLIPFILEVINHIILKKEGEQKQETFTPKIGGIIGVIYRSLITIGCLPYKAYVSFVSICKTIYRMTISHKHMLEWMTSEEAEKNAKNNLLNYYKIMWVNIVFAIVAIALLKDIYGVTIGILWISTPFIMWYISKDEIKKDIKEKLSKEQQQYVLEIGEKTWEYFKENLTEENNYLISDNYQVGRKNLLVDRTSSTNIGLSMLAVISAYDLKYIEIKDCIDLLEKIINTIIELPRWNGHLYNWYNIKTKEPLLPRYISTVDSGNFVGYLYVVKTFLEEHQEILSNKKQIDNISTIIEETDFSKLYSKEHRLFSIGFDIEENKLTDSYYDLLASEARQASIVAIAKKDVPVKHWYSLSRVLTILNNKKGLVSWSGTAFEYLMPNINIPRYEGSLLDESTKFLIMSQIEYSKKLELPWGISESAFNVKDLHSNYQYKAFGIPWLGLKRGLADDMVIASYASVLAINDKPKAVVRNLKELERLGMYDKYGFYESIDFTPLHLEKNKKSSPVLTYMAHHQALILLSINNFFMNNILQKRFMKNPELEATAILLQERMPETSIITKEEKEKPEKLKYQDYDNYTEVKYNRVNEDLIRGNIISNEKYTVAINQKGMGISKYKDIYINKFKKTDDYDQGIFFYIKNAKQKKCIKIGYDSDTDESNKYEVTFMPDQDKFEKTNGDIQSTLKIIVDSNEPVEIRRLEVKNLGNEEEVLEISSMFEPVLSPKEQEYAHPAFNNLFLEYMYDEKRKILLVKRRKRAKNDKDIYLATKLSTDYEIIVDNEYEIDKEKIARRGDFGIPRMIENSISFSNKIGLVTEPLIAMRKTIKLKKLDKAIIDLIISVNEDKEVAIKNLEKYTNQESVKKAFEISRAKSEAESKYLQIKGKDINIYQKILSYIVFENPIRKKQMEKVSDRVFIQSDLWKYGISGDLPIILVQVKDANDAYIIKQVLKMYEFFRNKNIKTELVILDEEKNSYENYIKQEIESKILDSHMGYLKNIKSGIFILSKNKMSLEDVNMLKFLSVLTIDSRKGDLEHLINDMEEDYLSNIKHIKEEKEIRIDTEDIDKLDILENTEKLKYYNEYGAFSADGKEYLIRINKENRLPTVWCNIMANEKFGTVVTENMGGYTWYKNSRLNRVTAWHNKAYIDIPAEIIYLKDCDTNKSWSLGLNPMPDNNNYNVIYGFGYTKYIHQSQGIKQELEVFVPKEDPIKVNILRLENNTPNKKKIRLIYYIKPVLGEDEIKSNEYVKVEYNKNNNILCAKNLYGNDFNNLVFISSSEQIKSYTGDKKFVFGKGGVSNPDCLRKPALNHDNGLGKPSCMAVELYVEIESFASKEIVINLGAEDDKSLVEDLSYKYSEISKCKEQLEEVKKYWKDILGRIQVYTPVESINIMLNGWILYQTMSSRLLGKTGFYQSGGAYGFRDQLQDTLSLKYIDNKKMKDQIIKHSKRQFIEGDVQHWWHEDTKRGIRTKFSDDLLWMVYVLEEYLEVTGDYEILNITTKYLEGNPLNQDEDERYDLYKESEAEETIYMHCIRAIEKSLNFGKRNLPKIGSGDWNDGFSNVGTKGNGESIWLGFFLYNILERIIPICEYKNDNEKVEKYKKVIAQLKISLNTNGWDGRWYKRAYTDNDEILGSIENDECRIDSIAQSWSVISHAADNDKKFIAMESIENHLIDRENGIIKLLDPPFNTGKLEPGYIKAYFPGARENGGQYTHEYCC